MDELKPVYIKCPFCDEEDFDLPGLKSHLDNGDCEVFNSTEVLIRWFGRGDEE